MTLQCSLCVLVRIHTHTQNVPILAKYHHMPLYYNYYYVRDIYYFGLLYNSCNADLCVCTLMFYYIHYYSRYYSICITLDFHTTPAVQICVYIYVHTHIMSQDLQNATPCFPLAAIWRNGKHFLTVFFPGKPGAGQLCPTDVGPAAPRCLCNYQRGFLPGDWVHSSTSDEQLWEQT